MDKTQDILGDVRRFIDRELPGRRYGTLQIRVVVKGGKPRLYLGTEDLILYED